MKSDRYTTASSSSASMKGEQKVGGIIIPTAQRKAAAGQGHRCRPRQTGEDERVPLDVKAGDTILFGKYSGQDIRLDGEEYFIMREDEVLACSIRNSAQRAGSACAADGVWNMAKQIIYGEQSRQAILRASTSSPTR